MPFLRTRNYKQFQVVDETTDTVVHTFEGASQANRALPGDEVAVDASGSVTLVARAPPPVLAGYLELNSKTTYGLTKRGLPLFLFVPLNPSYPSFIVSSSDRDRSTKKIALVEFLEWTHALPRGALKQIMGPALDLETEEQALLWTACPWSSLTKDLTILADDCPSRQELKGITFNIDPKGCKDIDDCVTLLKDGQDWLLTISIADVASAVEEMGAVDCMAANQGQTLYRDGVAVRPMLPPYYSEEHCSLVPGSCRRAVSLTLRFKGTNCVLSDPPVWSETLLTNQTSYSYEEFVASDQAPVLGQLVSAIKGCTVEDVHEWIEVLMIFYNTEAAKLLYSAGVGILRTHSAPDLDKLARYTALGPELKILASSAAQYCLIGSQETYEHWGLSTGLYCHATSPLRRYADLANQRILKQLIRGNHKGLCVSTQLSDLNERAKISKGYERDRVFLNALLRTGERIFDAIVLDIVQEEENAKLVLWVPLWQQKIKCRYTIVEPIEKGFRVQSADESRTFDLVAGSKVRIGCGLNAGLRRWKDRLVTTIL